MLVRWMNAFAGKNLNAKKTLAFELNRSSEVAAEKLQMVEGRKGQYLASFINKPWGLLLNDKAELVAFNGDCYSSYEGDRLVKGRNPRNTGSNHLESFCKPEYTGIVLSVGYTPNKHELRAMRNTRLPIYTLVKGALILMK